MYIYICICTYAVPLYHTNDFDFAQKSSETFSIQPQFPSEADENRRESLQFPTWMSHDVPLSFWDLS